MNQPITVLLVEDNPGDVLLTRDALGESRLLLNIDVAIDGPGALDYLLGQGRYDAPHTPDLIILDLNLPRLGGHEVLAEIKQHERLRSIPVVILTSSDAERDVSQTYAAGANSYVTKPVNLADFQAIVRSIEGFWFTVVKLP